MTKGFNMRLGLVVAVIGLFVLTPFMAQAQFSESWDFAKAVRDADYTKMAEKLNRGANINTLNKDGIPTIVVAADMGNEKLMRYLLENGANPNASITNSDETAIMRRADAGDMDSIKLLLEFGADINHANSTGETALMRAIRSRKRHVIKGLIEEGADLHLADYTGRTAIDYAEDTRSGRIIKLIRDAM